MCPETVRERLQELTSLKEYQVLSTNPRVRDFTPQNQVSVRAIKAICTILYGFTNILVSSNIHLKKN